MKIILLSLLVAAVAAAPRLIEDKPDAPNPAPVVLPGPAVPEVVPGPVVLPQPVLPGPEVEPEAPIIVGEPIIVEEPIHVDHPEPEPQIPTGEIYNDGLVQVTVNAPEEVGYLSALQSWFSMILNYFSNGVQTSHQIV